MRRAIIYIVILGIVFILLGVVVGIGIEKKHNLRNPFSKKGNIFAKRGLEQRDDLSHQERLLRRSEMLLNRIDQEIKLSPEQRQIIGEILVGSMSAAMQTQNELRDKLKKLKENARDQILEVLDEDQHEAFLSLSDLYINRFNRKRKMPNNRGDINVW